MQNTMPGAIKNAAKPFLALPNQEVPDFILRHLLFPEFLSNENEANGKQVSGNKSAKTKSEYTHSYGATEKEEARCSRLLKVPPQRFLLPKSLLESDREQTLFSEEAH